MKPKLSPKQIAKLCLANPTIKSILVEAAGGENPRIIFTDDGAKIEGDKSITIEISQKL